MEGTGGSAYPLVSKVQKTMDTMLEGLLGAVAVMDDILVYTQTKEKHEKIWRDVLEKATAWNLKMNLKKCNVGNNCVKYIGHIISSDGVHPHPTKWQLSTTCQCPPTKKISADF